MGVAGWNNCKAPATAIDTFHRRPTPQFIQPNNGILPFTRQWPRPQGLPFTIIPTYCLTRRYTQACSRQMRHRRKIATTSLMYCLTRCNIEAYLSSSNIHTLVIYVMRSCTRDYPRYLMQCHVIYTIKLIYHLVQRYLKADTTWFIVVRYLQRLSHTILCDTTQRLTPSSCWIVVRLCLMYYITRHYIRLS
jgi:hypothetical protein